MGRFRTELLLGRIEFLIPLVIASWVLQSCRKEEGCTDPDASNYEASAEADDGSCTYKLKVRFDHKVGDEELRFNDKDYVNEAGETYRIHRLRYLISDLVLHRAGKPDIHTSEHHLVRIAPNNSIEYGNDATNPSFSWSPSIDVPAGDYTGISFTFGFDSEDNGSGDHPALNQANWGWPDMLGGGYHYMQFEGEYDSSSTSTPVFNMHMGKARDTSGATTIYLNNHFHVDRNKGFTLDKTDRNIELQMDLAKWFTPPPASMENGNGAVWRLKERPRAVMPDYDSQRTLNANGRDVFMLKP